MKRFFSKLLENLFLSLAMHFSNGFWQSGQELCDDSTSTV